MTNHRRTDPTGHERRHEIEDLLTALRVLMHTRPHLRLGQLLDQALLDPQTQSRNDPFYIEDDVLLERLHALLDKQQQHQNREE